MNHFSQFKEHILNISIVMLAITYLHKVGEMGLMKTQLGFHISHG